MNFQNYALLLVCLLFFGCGSILLSIITPKDITKNLKVMTKDEKIIVFLPMVHLAKPSYFDKVKKVLDSLKKEDFTVFYEQVSTNKNQDPDTLGINLRKLRKMIGRNIAGGYDNRSNKSLPNFFKSGNYISQNNIELGIDSLDILADITLTELIKAHEKKNGKIILSDCDFKTALNDKYSCKKVGSYYAIHSFRDSIAANKVLKYNEQKAVLVFGKSHWYGIWPFFRDNGYVMKAN